MWNEKFNKPFSSIKMAPYLLVAIYQFGGSAHWKDVVQKVRDIIDVSDEVLNKVVNRKDWPDQDYIESQCQFGTSHARKAEYIKPASESSLRGYWELTDEGAKTAEHLLNADDDSLAKEVVRIVEEKYESHLAEQKAKKAEDALNEDELEPTEELEAEDLEGLSIDNDLKIIVEKLEPYQFEQLCLKLLRKMGADMESTPRSHDGGLDGIGIVTDNLLSFRIAVQIKRYKKDIKITGEQMRTFLGSLPDQQTKAIFITTSSFNRGAEQLAKEKLIRLIDGPRLIKLMREHGIGYEPSLNLGEGN